MVLIIWCKNLKVNNSLLKPILVTDMVFVFYPIVQDFLFIPVYQNRINFKPLIYVLYGHTLSTYNMYCTCY